MTVDKRLDLAALEELQQWHAAARPAPWLPSPGGITSAQGAVFVVPRFARAGPDGAEVDENLALTCALRNAAPELLRLARAALEVLPILEDYEDTHAKEWTCLAGALRILRAAAGAPTAPPVDQPSADGYTDL